jgi:hypothetical protein
MGHRAPIKIGAKIILERASSFFEMSNILPYNQPYSLYITIALVLLGVAGLFSAKFVVARRPDHFSYGDKLYRLFLVLWVLCWMVANSIAYVAFSPPFRPEDYAYIFNFSSVLLQVSGLIFIVLFMAHLVRLNSKNTFVLVWFVSILLIIGCGAKRIEKREMYQDGEKSYSYLRDNLSMYSIAPNAQVLIQGQELSINAGGDFWRNTGTLRYILGRNDVYGLIGRQDTFPNNIYDKLPITAFYLKMRGFSQDKPLIAFRSTEKGLERINLMLQVLRDKEKENSRLVWNLYDLRSDQEPPRIIATGNGMKSYSNWLNNELPPEFKNEYIVFSPHGESDDIIEDKEVAAIMASKENLLKSELKFSGYFTLRHVSAISAGDKYIIQLIMRVDIVPNGFYLGYNYGDQAVLTDSSDNAGCNIDLWDYVMEEDHLVIKLPPINKVNFSKGMIVKFLNKAVFPNRKIIIEGGELDGQDSIILKFTDGGPLKTKANTVFNKQPDGNAAMWLNVENASESTHVMFGSKDIKPDFNNSQLLTFMVPKELYSTPGKYEIYIFNPPKGKKSNSLYFTVE